MSIDPDAFNAYERNAWNTVADVYIQGFGPLVLQSIEPLLDAVGLAAGMTFLDVACGPGWLAATAAERGAESTGVDVSETMLEEARRRHPRLDFQLGNAESLPFEAEAFDAVGCNFGMLHFGRPDQAATEAFRVLRPGGRFAFTVWATPVQTAAFEIVLGALQAHGQLDVGLPPGPPFFRFSDPVEATGLLQAVGFVDTSVQTVAQTWRLASGEQLFDIMCRGTGRTRGLLLGQTVAARDAIRATVLERAGALEKAGGLELAMPSVLSSARKPG